MIPVYEFGFDSSVVSWGKSNTNIVVSDLRLGTKNSSWGKSNTNIVV